MTGIHKQKDKTELIGADATLRHAFDEVIDANPDANPVLTLTIALADYLTDDDTYRCLVLCAIRDLMGHTPDDYEGAEIEATEAEWVN